MIVSSLLFGGRPPLCYCGNGGLMVTTGVCFFMLSIHSKTRNMLLFKPEQVLLED